MAGPTIRAALKTEEFNAMALGKSFLLSTKEDKRACLPNTSKALITPCVKPSTHNHVTDSQPTNTTNVNNPACNIRSTCVHTTSLYLERLSTKEPIKGDSTNEGRREMKETKPNQNTEFVSSYTIQLMAMRCIHVPRRDNDCPIVCSLKLG